MLNLSRISPIADFCSEIRLQLTIINKNILYITHEVDKINKLLKADRNDTDLQKQVDEYFEENPESEPGKVNETSPQTESDEQ